MEIINLCFHGIGTPRRTLEPDEDVYWISARLYHQVLDEVASRPDVALSFDDGNSSDIEHGLPALLERGLNATFFALAGRLEHQGSLSGEDLKALRQSGMTIGTHGMEHVPWRYLSADERHREFLEARDRISEASGSEVREAALPLGRYDRSVLSHLRKAGYDHVYSSDRRRARPASWFQPRYSLHADDTIDTVRSTILARPRPADRVRGLAVGFIKRIR